MRLFCGALLVLAVRCSGISVGIDLGTSNSAVAVLRNGACQVLDNIGDGPMGSLRSVCHVVTPEDEVHYGDSPDDKALEVRGWKRALGLDAKSATWRLSDRERRLLRLDDGSADVDGRVNLIVGDALRTGLSRARPVACTEKVLEELVRRAERCLDERVDKAVVGVPASYLPAQREALLVAARRCLPNVEKIQLANEPELAAHSYGYGSEKDDAFVASGETREEALVLVFDLGGGTLDVSIVAVGGKTRTMEVIATSGDPCLGGIDFTRALQRAVEAKRKEARRARGGPRIECDFDEAERLKIALCDAAFAFSKSNYQEQCKAEIEDGGLVLTLRDLEREADDLLRNVAACVRRVALNAGARLPGDFETFPDDDSDVEKATRQKLKRKKKKKRRNQKQYAENLKEIRDRLPKGQTLRRWPSAEDAAAIDRVVLVGAATRMPCVPRLLSALTGLDVAVDDHVPPEHAVARGAAVKAAMNDDQVDDFVVFDHWQAEVLRHFVRKEARNRRRDDDSLMSKYDDAKVPRDPDTGYRIVTLTGPDGQPEQILVDDSV